MPRITPVEAGRSPFIHTIAVVQMAGTVQREPYEKAVSGQKFAPRVIEQNAVGLQRVLYPFAVCMPLLQGKDTTCLRCFEKKAATNYTNFTNF